MCAASALANLLLDASETVLKTIDDVNVAKRRVLLRVDYNIPPNVDGSPVDDFRMLASVPTLRTLMERKARTIILTHRGRPGGRVDPRLSTEPLALRLRELLGAPVAWAPDCIGRVAEQAVEKLAPGGVLLLENTRFHLGEAMNQRPFVAQLMRLGEVFVNDAFATAHRAHASTTGLAAAMPESVLGPLMMKEIGWVKRVLDSPARPLCLLLGGGQVGGKLALLQKLLPRMDSLLVGGVMANTLLAARDMGLGRSHIEPSYLEAARDVVTEAGILGCRLLLPNDVLTAPYGGDATQAQVRPIHQVAPNDVVWDIGPHTLEIWRKVIAAAGTVVWIGSVGAFENPAYRHGTALMAEAVASNNGFTLAGGDGLLRALHQLGVRDRLPQVSTAGAALLEALSGNNLPALQIMASRQEGGWDGIERRSALRP